MRHRLTIIAELATIGALIVATLAFLVDLTSSGTDSAKPAPSTMPTAAPPTRVVTATPSAGARPTSPEAKPSRSSRPDSSGSDIREAIEDLAANVHDFGSNWSGSALAGWAFAFLLIVYGPFIANSAYEGGCLPMIGALGLPVLWVWVFWSSLSIWGILLFAVVCFVAALVSEQVEDFL